MMRMKIKMMVIREVMVIMATAVMLTVMAMQ
jgi:hypothetical protein